MNHLPLQNELFAACCHNEADTVRKLLLTGAFADARFVNGLTPLMVAARAGAHDALNALLEAGADATARDNRGRNALNWLCRFGLGSHYHPDCHFESARLLMEAGADPYETDAQGDAALWLSCRRPLRTVLKLIHAHRNIRTEIRDKNGDSPLHVAARTSYYYTVHTLIQMGFDPDTPNAEGKTAKELYQSYEPECFWKPRETKEEREFCLKPYGPHERKKFPVADAMMQAKQADLKARDKRGNTALHRFATWGIREAIAILLDRGASIDEPNNEGTTPLMQAARCGRWRVGALLLAHGADFQRRDKHGKNARDYALAAGNYRLLTMMP